MTKQFVPALRSDIKPGARMRVNYEHGRTPARDVSAMYGTVTTDPVRMRRGDLMFSIECGAGSVLIRHGDYTGTELWVEVDVEARIKSLMAERKRAYKARAPLAKAGLVGGPLDGATVLLSVLQGASTLPLTCKGMTGIYTNGRWMPADERSAQ